MSKRRALFEGRRNIISNIPLHQSVNSVIIEVETAQDWWLLIMSEITSSMTIGDVTVQGLKVYVLKKHLQDSAKQQCVAQT